MTIETPIVSAQPPKPEERPYPVEQPLPRDRRRGVPAFVWVLVSCVACLIVFTVIGVLWISSGGDPGFLVGGDPVSSAVSLAPSSAAPASSAPVSSEPDNQIPVPNLVGQEYESLVSQAQTDYQILPAAQRQFSDTVAEGCIISQTPEYSEGKTMTKGTAIVVVISQGPSVRELPNITNLPLADASTAVAEEGFVPSKIEEYSDTIPKGYAIGYQNAKAGDKMPYGSPVVLVISKGPDPTKD